jgi:predicted acetyltransferase
VGEFFVVRAARRQRVGHEAAIELLRLHPGCWGSPSRRRTGAPLVSGDAWRPT